MFILDITTMRHVFAVLFILIFLLSLLLYGLDKIDKIWGIWKIRRNFIDDYSFIFVIYLFV